MPAADESEVMALCERNDFEQAATWVLRTYGTEILTYLYSVEPTADEANEVFSEFHLALWRSLPRFRRQCSLRTFAYALARRERVNAFRARLHRRADVPLSQEAEAVAQRVRTETARYLRTTARSRLAEACASLDKQDRSLLLLRMEQKLEWLEIARVMTDDDDVSEGELTRLAATLRKRFERLKEQLRRELRGESD